eukprot:jgi/Chlat1/5046/Chrsp33S05051
MASLPSSAWWTEEVLEPVGHWLLRQSLVLADVLHFLSHALITAFLVFVAGVEIGRRRREAGSAAATAANSPFHAAAAANADLNEPAARSARRSNTLEGRLREYIRQPDMEAGSKSTHSDVLPELSDSLGSDDDYVAVHSDGATSDYEPETSSFSAEDGETVQRLLVDANKPISEFVSEDYVQHHHPSALGHWRASMRWRRLRQTLQTAAVFTKPLRTGGSWLRQRVAQYEERLMCIVCRERERSYALRPCGHFCLCASCVKEYTKLQDRDSFQRCPLCREPVDEVIKTHL